MIYIGKRMMVKPYLGAKDVKKIYLGNSLVWINTIPITFDFDGVTTTASDKVESGGTYVAVLSVVSGMTLVPSSVSVMMGNTDITSTAWNSSNNTITISSVTDDVTITATALQIITFADTNVKSICVTNWGGNYFNGEITTLESASVTSLDGKFRGNTSISSFNELQYFTGLTNLGNSTNGEFQGCTALASVVIPSALITDATRAFYNCTALQSLDLSPLTPCTNLNIARLVQSSNNSANLTTIKLAGGTYSSLTATFSKKTGLTTIVIDGTADLSSISGFASVFENCSALTTITGTITGIKANIDFSACPLDVASATMIVAALDTPSAARTLKLKSSMRSTYEADANFNAAVANKPSAWTISYA